MGSVERSLTVLEMIIQSDIGPTHAELGIALRIPKSTLSQILRELQRTGYVGCHDRHYLPGVRLLSLAHRAALAAEMRSAVRAWMDTLAADSGETVILGILAGTHVTYIDEAPGPHPVRYVAPLGQPRPLHATALGKVLLAFAGRSAREFAPLDSYTKRTLTDPDAVDKELGKIRRDGYAISIGEAVDGVGAIAAPLFNSSNELVAAMSVTGPSRRIQDAKERVPPLLLETARRLKNSGVLG